MSTFNPNIPIGKILRIKESANNKKNNIILNKLSSLDAEIEKLNKELSKEEQNIGSGSDSDHDSDTDSYDSRSDHKYETNQYIYRDDSLSKAKVCEKVKNENFMEEKDINGNVIRIVSLIGEKDKIAPLPKKLLPSSSCKTKVKIDGLPEPKVFQCWDCKLYGHKSGDDICKMSSSASSSLAPSDRKKNLRFVEDSDKIKQIEIYSSDQINPPKKSKNETHMTGLDATVKEMMQDYQPAQRKPFYCRICDFQGLSLDDYNAHVALESHLIKSKAERKLNSCKLCKKEFTSSNQLKEHLKGKAHLETLNKYRKNSR